MPRYVVRCTFPGGLRTCSSRDPNPETRRVPRSKSTKVAIFARRTSSRLGSRRNMGRHANQRNGGRSRGRSEYKHYLGSALARLMTTIDTTVAALVARVGVTSIALGRRGEAGAEVGPHLG